MRLRFNRTAPFPAVLLPPPTASADPIQTHFLSHILPLRFSPPQPEADFVSRIPGLTQQRWTAMVKALFEERYLRKKWDGDPRPAFAYHIRDLDSYLSFILGRRLDTGRLTDPLPPVDEPLVMMHYTDGLGRPLGRWHARTHTVCLPQLMREAHAQDSWIPLYLNLGRWDTEQQLYFSMFMHHLIGLDHITIGGHQYRLHHVSCNDMGESAFDGVSSAGTAWIPHQGQKAPQPSRLMLRISPVCTSRGIDLTRVPVPQCKLVCPRLRFCGAALAWFYGRHAILHLITAVLADIIVALYLTGWVGAASYVQSAFAKGRSWHPLRDIDVMRQEQDAVTAVRPAEGRCWRCPAELGIADEGFVCSEPTCSALVCGDCISAAERSGEVWCPEHAARAGGGGGGGGGGAVGRGAGCADGAGGAGGAGAGGAGASDASTGDSDSDDDSNSDDSDSDSDDSDGDSDDSDGDSDDSDSDDDSSNSDGTASDSDDSAAARAPRRKPPPKCSAPRKRARGKKGKKKDRRDPLRPPHQATLQKAVRLARDETEGVDGMAAMPEASLRTAGFLPEPEAPGRRPRATGRQVMHCLRSVPGGEEHVALWEATLAHANELLDGTKDYKTVTDEGEALLRCTAPTAPRLTRFCVPLPKNRGGATWRLQSRRRRRRSPRGRLLGRRNGCRPRSSSRMQPPSATAIGGPRGM